MDFVEMVTPVVFDRVVLADRGAAARSSQPGAIWSGASFEGEGNAGADAGKEWFEPIRQNLAGMLEDAALANAGGKRQVVTYISTQRALGGDSDSGRVGRLRDEDHRVLVEGLRGLGSGVKVNVVEAVAGAGEWKERMAAIVGSTVRFVLIYFSWMFIVFC